MTIFNRFAKFAIREADANIYDAYNAFVRNELNDEERKFVANNCMLMIKIGEAARGAMPSVKKLLA